MSHFTNDHTYPVHVMKPQCPMLRVIAFSPMPELSVDGTLKESSMHKYAKHTQQESWKVHEIYFNTIFKKTVFYCAVLIMH
jgi:hypothetical protein